MFDDLLQLHPDFAKELLRRAAHNYELADMHDEAARCWMQLGETESAVQNLIQAGDFGRAADVAVDLKDYDTAYQLYLRWQEKHPNDSKIFSMLGLAVCYTFGQGALNRPHEAVNLELHVLNQLQAPDASPDRQAWERLGWYGGKVGRYDLVHMGYEEALSTVRDVPDSDRLRIGNAYHQALRGHLNYTLIREVEENLLAWGILDDDPNADTMSLALERAHRFSGQKNSHWTPFTTTFADLQLPDTPFCLVPVGTFQMGDDNGTDKERPVHTQTIERPYWISQYPVTNAMWRKAVEAGAVLEPNRQNGSRLGFISDSANEWYNDPKKANAPVAGISWEQAHAFAKWMGCRLPTEREWSFAARGVESWLYPWGNDWQPDRCFWNGNSERVTHDVSEKPEGVSWVGAHHMTGNVWEWTNSADMPYPYKANDGRESENVTKEKRILKGSSYGNEQQYLRTTYRLDRERNYIAVTFGLRLAHD